MSTQKEDSNTDATSAPSGFSRRAFKPFITPNHGRAASPPPQVSRRKTAPGFATLASFQSSDPELQLYRSFSTLSSRNLAYLQAELTALETEIAAMDDQERSEAQAREEGWMERLRPARCWEVSERKAGEGSAREAERMRLMGKLRSLMGEYQDALLRQNKLLALEPPMGRAWKVMRDWWELHRPLIGHSYGLFDNEHEHDMVALWTPPDQDRLTSLLQNNLGYYLQSKRHEGQGWEGVTYFQEPTIRHIVSVLSVVISALLLVGAIVALYFTHNQRAKLGLIAVFTMLFAASIGLLTNARKAEVYAATAA